MPSPPHVAGSDPFTSSELELRAFVRDFVPWESRPRAFELIAALVDRHYEQVDRQSRALREHVIPPLHW